MMNADGVGISASAESRTGSTNAAISAVMASEFRNWSTGEGIASGLRSCGWLIEEVDSNHYHPPGGGRVFKILKKLLRPALRRSFNQTICMSCEKLEAKALISIKGSDLDNLTIHRLREQGVFTVIYYPDVCFDHRNVDIAVILGVDVLITAKSFQLEWLRELRGSRPTFFVHHGFPPSVRHLGTATAEEDYAYDIAYVGNPDRNKLDLLTKVAAAFPDRKIVVAGNRWRAAAAGTDLEPFVLGYPLSGDFMADLHRSSRINVGVHMDPQANGWADLVSTRTFEIPAFGGFMLHVDNPEVRDLYDVPGEIDVFEGADELIEKIAYYLDRPDLRREMIDRAHRRAVPAYSYHMRGVEIDRLLRPLIG